MSILKNIAYISAENALSHEEITYWKRMFQNNLKIGVEMESEYARSTDSSEMRRTLSSFFTPTESVSNFGKYGVCGVKTDGSLSNGMELTTVGRRVEFIDLYEQYKFICNKMWPYQPTVNKRAGLHNHVLFDYGSGYTSLEKDIPGIIFKNLMQLTRRYIPELIWITSTVKGSGNTITRSGGYCGQSSLVATAASRTAAEFVNNIANERYSFANLNHMSCSGNNVRKFHIEFRFPDASLWPAQIAAQNVLYASLITKAIELSEHGLIMAGDSEDWLETKRLGQAIRSTDDRSQRHEDPRELSNADMALIKERAIDMILKLKPQICKNDPHAYTILRLLADTPISIMRKTKEDTEINTYFDTMIQSMYDTKVPEAEDIIKIINTLAVTGCNSKEDWVAKVGTKLGKNYTEIGNKLFWLGMETPLDFDAELGSEIFK